MTLAEAYHVLQLEPGAPRELIEQRFAEQKQVLQQKRASAPSPGQKAHVQQGLARLTTAREVLIQREDAAADAARRQRGSRQPAAAGLETRTVTAADVAAAVDQWPRRLNRHADGIFRALVAALAGGLAGLGSGRVFTPVADERMPWVAGGLLAGLMLGIGWWRVAVQRLRREEWTKVREALERREVLPVAWQRQALRLALMLLLLLGFSIGSRRWMQETRVPSTELQANAVAEVTTKRLAGSEPDHQLDGTGAKASPELGPRASASVTPETSRRDDAGKSSDRVKPAPAPIVAAYAANETIPQARPSRLSFGPERPARPERSGEGPAEKPSVAPAPRSTAGPVGRAGGAMMPDPAVAPVRGGPESAPSPGPAPDPSAEVSARLQQISPRTPESAPAGADLGPSVPAAPTPADIVRAETERVSAGDAGEGRTVLAEAYQAWAKKLRQDKQPGLALYALDRAAAEGAPGTDALAAALRKEFAEANPLTVELSPPDIREDPAAAGRSGAALGALGEALAAALQDDLAAGVPDLVTLKTADPDEKTPRGETLRLRLRVETRAAGPVVPVPAIVAEGSVPGAASPPAAALPDSVEVSVVLNDGDAVGAEVVLLSLTTPLREPSDVRAPALSSAAILAAARAELDRRLRQHMPELLVNLAEASLAVLQARRARAAGDREAPPGDLAWGWFAVWAEAGLTLPQVDAELAARRALALPESQPVRETANQPAAF